MRCVCVVARNSSRPKPPISLIVNHIHIEIQIQYPKRSTNCVLINEVRHRLFFPAYHNVRPKRHSTIATSKSTSGDHAIARSLRVAESRPSNLNRSIVATTTDIMEVRAELQSSPSAARMRAVCVGWNSSNVSMANESPASKADTTLSVK